MIKDDDVLQVAYELWIELNTRKLVISFDEEYDLISEVYDSWYSFFNIAREILKKILVSKNISEYGEVLFMGIAILNDELRPHLTKFQAEYKEWWFTHKDDYILTPDDYSLTLQEIQREYPKYDELIKDMQDTIKRIQKYNDKLYKMLFMTKINLCKREV